ncbi:MAG: helix-turn-helix transcriptional regulator [Kordiimonadaceae bacterium]|nr:helix-turn-helix transcriptional regulator [Kordiimonadaceae bacterium]MBO6570507.1 helix-turn-helix transcriptional regulator [Kordiimonadaceae bacterium]MBO6966374.1 helix-turn-helix transcriptional regulator [Kordiimonadaceae bacterium]
MSDLPSPPHKSPTETIMDPVLFDSHGAPGAYRLSKNGHLHEKHDFSQSRTLPVRGRAQGGKDGNFVIEEHPIDWTFRPADLQGVDEAFSVYVNGDSMAPKYKNGDLAYIHPAKPPRKGRFVLVETSDHKGFIKQLVGWRDDHLEVRQFNPEKLIRIEKQNVLRVMLVIGSLDA